MHSRLQPDSFCDKAEVVGYGKMCKLFLTFDCEDFINNRSTLALKRILELLQKYNLKAIFFITGHACEKLSASPHVLNLLEQHEIGYHCTSHSVHPNVFEYTDIENYQTAYHISLERETKRVNPLTGELEGKGGIFLLKDLFPNNGIVTFRAAGFCWTPPHLEALEKLGIRFDFSTNLSPLPVHYKRITFYPFADAGYSCTPIARQLFRRLKSRDRFLRDHSLYVVLLGHPNVLINETFWDRIYYNGNPDKLRTVPPRNYRKVQNDLRSFELFLKRASFLAKNELVEITPPLQKGIIKKSFTEEDVMKCYHRSLKWSRDFFNYKPKFLFRHFLKFFGMNSGVASLSQTSTV